MDVTFLFTPETLAGIRHQLLKRPCHFAPRTAEGATRGKMAQGSPRGKAPPGEWLPLLSVCGSCSPHTSWRQNPGRLTRDFRSGRCGRAHDGGVQPTRCLLSAPRLYRGVASHPLGVQLARPAHGAQPAGWGPLVIPPRPRFPHELSAAAAFLLSPRPRTPNPCAATLLFAFPPNANTAAFSNLRPSPAPDFEPGPAGRVRADSADSAPGSALPCPSPPSPTPISRGSWGVPPARLGPAVLLSSPSSPTSAATAEGRGPGGPGARWPSELVATTRAL